MLVTQIGNKEMNLEQSFIRKITGGLLHYRFKGGDVHQFCCPYCQTHGTDKAGRKISSSKAKGYFYKKEDSINFKCHKCGTGKQFHNLLRDHFQKEFLAYVKERELRGTTGKGHNCPTLANALESVGKLKFDKPEFNKYREDSASKTSETSDKQSLTRMTEDSDHTKEDDTKFIIHDGRRFKLTPCPPATTPQALAGHGAQLNREMNRIDRMRRERCGELW